MLKNYYKTLEINSTATPDDIKKAYRRLAHQYHPDKNRSEDARFHFSEINEAYSILSDTENRRKYDIAYSVQLFYSNTDSYLKIYERYQYDLQNNKPAIQTPKPVIAVRKKRTKNEELRKLSKYWLIVAYIIFTFSTLLLIDFLIPTIERTEAITEMYDTPMSNSSFSVRTPSAKFLISRMYLNASVGDPVTVYFSPLFRIVKRVEIAANCDCYSYPTAFIIFGEASFFPVLMLITSFMGVFFRKEHEFAISATMVSMFLFVITIALM